MVVAGYMIDSAIYNPRPDTPSFILPVFTVIFGIIAAIISFIALIVMIILIIRAIKKEKG